MTKHTVTLNKKSIMKKISNLLSLGILLLVTACSSNKAGETKSESANIDSVKNDKIKTVEVTRMMPHLFNSFIDIQGKVDADENVTINAQMPGTVSKVNVHLGNSVNVGQVLAELDSKVIEQGIAELQGAIDLANTMYEKQKNLWDQKIGSEIQFLTSKNQKESLEKKMTTLHEQLKMSKIISPINGIVDAIDIKIGQATMPGLPAIRVVNMSSLKVKGEVGESYLAKVKIGNDVIIILPDMQDTLKAKISYAAKVISPLNRTFTVTVNLDGKKELSPNMVAIMKIIDYSNPEALIVPVNAIQKTTDGDFVFIASNKQAKKAKVKVGKIYNGNAEISEGLKEGDNFISKGYHELNEGEEVKF